jgi:hypothetical protein
MALTHRHDPATFTQDATIRQAVRDALADLLTIQNAAFANNTQRDNAIRRVAEVLRHAVRTLISGV